ncbi:signal recognition particle-docking protein FtsY [Anaerolineales bacterium]
MSIFKRGLEKTRGSFLGKFNQLLGNSEIDDSTWDDIEATLIQADLGIETTEVVIEYLKNTAQKNGLTKTSELMDALKEALLSLLEAPPPLNITGRELSVILIVGVNGSGKTTSIAKLAHRLNRAGRKVVLAAGDTFRAAAIEQLQTWGERANVPVIASEQGSDPGAVVYNALEAAKAKKADVLIIDTAGRLHNNFNLMRELEKIKGIIKKSIPDAPHEVLLVLDGTTGQNALQQAQRFREASEVTGLIITKLDGTSKGGMIFSVYNDLELPIQYIGLGEGIDDLIHFNPEYFVDSLFE